METGIDISSRAVSSSQLALFLFAHIPKLSVFQSNFHYSPISSQPFVITKLYGQIQFSAAAPLALTLQYSLSVILHSFNLISDFHLLNCFSVLYRSGIILAGDG